MVGFSLRGPGYPWAEIGDDPMSMAGFELSQALPWPGKLGRRRAAAEASAAVVGQDLVSARRRIAAAVRAGYASLYAVDREDEALLETTALIDLLLGSVTARYETSQASQFDLVRLQLERVRLDERRDDLAAMRAELQAGLNAWLDRPGGTAITTASQLPETGVLEPGGSAPADSFAEVRVARARLDAARLRTASARRERWPDLSIGAEYGYRGSLDPMVSARIGVELPIWSGQKQGAMLREARQEETMAGADVREALLDAGSTIETLEARVRAAASQIRRLDEETVPRAGLALDAARAAYTTGRGDAGDLIEGIRLLVEARSMRARREADLYTAISTWRALAGRDPVGEENGHER